MRLHNNLVSVYVSRRPDYRGLAIWQWVTLGIGVLLVLRLTPYLMFTGALSVFAKAILFIGGMVGVVVAIKYPTKQNPLQYLSYLSRKPPVTPTTHLIEQLNDVAVLCSIGGQQKIIVGCEALEAQPRLQSGSTSMVSHFIGLLGERVDFVVTTGRPHCEPHDEQSKAPFCLLMIDALEDAQLRANNLVTCAQLAGFQLKRPSDELFEIVAGHNMTATHYIVEQLPYELPLGWLSCLGRCKTDFTAIVGISPADLLLAKKEALAVLRNSAFVHQAMGSLQSEVYQLSLLRRGAQSLLDGETRPFDLSVDMVLVSDSALKSVAVSNFLAVNFGMSHIIELKKVRSRKLPFGGAFTEVPVHYRLTVSEAAAVASCPFFLQVAPVREIGKRHSRIPPAK